MQEDDESGLLSDSTTHTSNIQEEQ